MKTRHRYAPAPSPISSASATSALTLLLSALALAGCSPRVADDTDFFDGRQEAPAAADNGSMPVAADSPAVPATGDATANSAADTSTAGAGNETIGGDGSAIRLSPLSASDIAKADLPGELACTFRGTGDALLLLAKGDVGSAAQVRGVVKVLDYVEPIGTLGGFNGMMRGATFSGKGKTIEIVLTGAATGDGESPQHPATLTYQRGDGASRSFPGSWTCGA